MRCYGWAEAAKRDVWVGSLRSYAVWQLRLHGSYAAFRQTSQQANKRSMDCGLADWDWRSAQDSLFWTITDFGSKIYILKVATELNFNLNSYHLWFKSQNTFQSLKWNHLSRLLSSLFHLFNQTCVRASVRGCFERIADWRRTELSRNSRALTWRTWCSTVEGSYRREDNDSGDATATATPAVSIELTLERATWSQKLTLEVCAFSQFRSAVNPLFLFVWFILQFSRVQTSLYRSAQSIDKSTETNLYSAIMSLVKQT